MNLNERTQIYNYLLKVPLSRLIYLLIFSYSFRIENLLAFLPQFF